MLLKLDMEISNAQILVLIVTIFMIPTAVAQPPTFDTNCPANVTEAPTVGETSLVVDFVLPTAQDSAGDPAQVSCSHQPKDSFPLGDTTVTCTATDGADPPNTAQCTFKVSFGDGTSCERNLNGCLCIRDTGICTCGTGFTGVDCAIADGSDCTDGITPSAGCGDTCPSAPCGCEEGWQGPACNVVDDGSLCDYEGQPSQCERCFGAASSPPCVCELGWKGVTCQIDYIPPFFVTCPNDTVKEADSGEDSTMVTWDDPQAEDNTGNIDYVECDPPSDSRFNVGVNLVTCTTSDGTNTASDCTFNVTIMDIKAPDMTCPESNIWFVDPGRAVATTIWSPLPSANDTVDGQLVVTCRNDDDEVVMSEDQFPVGVTHVTCSALDNSRNRASCDFNITVVDNEGPVVTCPNSIAQNVEPGKADAAVVWSPLPSAEDVVDGVVPNVTCEDGDGMEVGSGDRFPAGDTRVTCLAADSIGNEGNCSFIISVKDNEAPLVACSDDISQNVDAGSAVGTVTWSRMPSANDTVDGALEVQCRDDSDKLVESRDKFPVGVTVVTCRASDSSSNEGNCSFTITVTDNEAPVMTCAGNFTQALDPGSAVGTVIWPQIPSANDTVDGSLEVKCTNDLDEPVESEDKFPVGVTVVTCRASDSSSNEGNCSFTITVTDNEGPVVMCPNSIAQNVEPGKADAAVVWSPLPSAEDVVDGVVPNVTCEDGDGRKVGSDDRFPAGDTRVTCSAADSIGNEGNCSFTVTIEDNEPPIMTCSEDVTENVNAESVFGTVTWSQMPSANDTVDGSLEVQCRDDSDQLVESGEKFPVGVTVVTCRASDSSSNEGNCSFTITVTDNAGPVVTCPNDTAQNVEPGKADAAVVWSLLLSAEDVVEGVVPNVTCEDEGGMEIGSGDRFPAGDTVITCSAFDSLGNEGNCSFTITVIDNESPFLICPASVNDTVRQGVVNATVIWPQTPSANDTVDGALEVQCRDDSDKLVESGDEFAVGTTVVMCRALDSSGNVDNCTFTITVIYDAVPTIKCPGNGRVNIAEGKNTASVTWVSTANDTIEGELQTSCVPEQGSEFPPGISEVECSATDQAMNRVSCSFTITVTADGSDCIETTRVCQCDSGICVCAEGFSTSYCVIADASYCPVVDVNNTYPHCVGQCPDECFCQTGYKGYDCNECKGCQNGGVNQDIESCECQCPNEGFEAPICAVCKPCENDGYDQNPDNCTCTCNEAHQGVLCSECRECVNGNNQNGTTCVCECFGFYQGTLCNVCPEDVQCGNGGTFNETSCGCSCPTPWQGIDCSECMECENGGIDQDPDTCICDCPGVYLQPLCTECGGSQLCQNAGEFSESFCNCTCPLPFAGKTCRACEPCQNGGSDQDPDTCECVCPDLYTGSLCSECKECVNGVNQNSVCVCDCFNSYQGPLCDVCPEDVQCANGGSFDETSCTCSCPVPWQGSTCTDCMECMFGGTNQDPDTCVCDCPGAYLPPICTECGGDACENGGQFSADFCNCTCPSPFTGKTCTECQPCQNGALFQNKFTCVCDCPYFHIDPLCTVCPVGIECLNGGARNEATCSCECAEGWRGRDCSELVPDIPDDEYPVSPTWPVVEKKVSFEIAVISLVVNNQECIPAVDKYSAPCNAVVAEFKLAVEIEYKFVVGFSRVEIDQDGLRAGSVVVPHEVIYNYNEMTPDTRGISANALYEETVGKAVDRGWIGRLQVASKCTDCQAAQDNTNVCEAQPPACATGLTLIKKMVAGACYYVCQSKCKDDPTYCGEGTCNQEVGSEEISCSCPQSSSLMYSGGNCQLRVQLPWLYVGVGLGGFVVILLIVILSVCLCKRNREANKLKQQDDEKVDESDLIEDINAYHNARKMYFSNDPRPRSSSASRGTQTYPYAYVYKNMKSSKNNRAQQPQSPQNHKYQVRIKNTDYDDLNEDGGHRDEYFWGNLTIPTKEDTEMIPMTSETGRF